MLRVDDSKIKNELLGLIPYFIFQAQNVRGRDAEKSMDCLRALNILQQTGYIPVIGIPRILGQLCGEDIGKKLFKYFKDQLLFHFEIDLIDSDLCIFISYLNKKGDIQ